jgi:phosphoribosylglycinamide formyltransferase 2
LTVRACDGVSFCDPIGHVQKEGDYIESWQPHPMSSAQLERAQDIARKVVDGLGGWGLFGVELFLLKGGEVLFSEVSPRPHDTGLVTLGTQNLSEFALHVRAFLGLPIGGILTVRAGASAAIRAAEASVSPVVTGLENALLAPETQVRIFGKPKSHRNRRMGVAISTAESVPEARERAKSAERCIKVV